MAEPTPPQAGTDIVPPSTSSRHALTPAAMDVLRTKAHPRRPDDEQYDHTIEANETGTAPLRREEPLSPFMINPKYLDHDDETDVSEGLIGHGLTGGASQAVTPQKQKRELQTAGQGQTFHDTLEMPMSSPLAIDRIRRRRDTTGDTIQEDDARDSHEQQQTDQAVKHTPDTRQSRMATLSAAGAGFGAGLAAMLARGRGTVSGGLDQARNYVSDKWSHFRARPKKVDYTHAAGSRRHGIAGVDPKLPIIIPLLAVLAVLALGVLTGAFDSFRIGSGSQANTDNGDTTQQGQTGGRGAGEDGSAQNGTSGSDANAGTGAGSGTNTDGSTTQGTTGTVPTAPDGTPLPVGGRGGGDGLAPTPTPTPTTAPTDGSVK